MDAPSPAPPWITTAWLNTSEALELERLRGRVVMLHAFQMLCPACVARGIPQSQRVASVFPDELLGACDESGCALPHH